MITLLLLLHILPAEAADKKMVSEFQDQVLAYHLDGDKAKVSLAKHSALYWSESDPIRKCLFQSVEKKRKIQLKVDPFTLQVIQCEPSKTTR
jgi:hypothetical protein